MPGVTATHKRRFSSLKRIRHITSKVHSLCGSYFLLRNNYYKCNVHIFVAITDFLGVGLADTSLIFQLKVALNEKKTILLSWVSLKNKN